MSDISQSVTPRYTREKTQAQKWGETAVAFIASAASSGIFGILAYVLWPTTWLALTCLGLAAISLVVLAFKSIAIVRWWIIIAKRTVSS